MVAVTSALEVLMRHKGERKKLVAEIERCDVWEGVRRGCMLSTRGGDLLLRL